MGVGPWQEDPKFKASLSCTVKPCLKGKPNVHRKENRDKDKGELDAKFKKMKGSSHKAEKPSNRIPDEMS